MRKVTWIARTPVEKADRNASEWFQSAAGSLILGWPHLAAAEAAAGTAHLVKGGALRAKAKLESKALEIVERKGW